MMGKRTLTETKQELASRMLAEKFDPVSWCDKEIRKLKGKQPVASARDLEFLFSLRDTLRKLVQKRPRKRRKSSA